MAFLDLNQRMMKSALEAKIHETPPMTPKEADAWMSTWPTIDKVVEDLKNDGIHSIIVSNLLKESQKEFYSMLLSQDELLYVEEGHAAHHEWRFDVHTHAMTIDGTPMAETDSKQFAEKLGHALKDYQHDRVKVYKRTL